MHVELEAALQRMQAHFFRDDRCLAMYVTGSPFRAFVQEVKRGGFPHWRPAVALCSVAINQRETMPWISVARASRCTSAADGDETPKRADADGSDGGNGDFEVEAEALVKTVEEVYFSDPELTPVLDGQMRYSCVRSDEGPGKPLSACRKVSVTLTLLHREDKHDVAGLAAGGVSAEVRQRRIVRLVEEAREQGGLLTQEDLAEILMCDVRTIRRDIHLLKKRGFELPTRGQQQIRANVL